MAAINRFGPFIAHLRADPNQHVLHYRGGRVARQRGLEARLPGAEASRLAWLVREPFPSVATGVSLDYGELRHAERLEIVSEMPEDGVVFGDGIESDALELVAGQRLRVGLADRTLRLVVRSPGAGRTGTAAR